MLYSKSFVKDNFLLFENDKFELNKKGKLIDDAIIFLLLWKNISSVILFSLSKLYFENITYFNQFLALIKNLLHGEVCHSWGI